MKKIVCIVSIILIVLVIISTFLITNRKLSKDEYISLMEKFETVTNVKIEEPEVVQYLKDGVKLSIVNDYYYTWVNSNTKECIYYSPEAKQYIFLEYEEDDYLYLDDSKYKFIRI